MGDPAHCWERRAGQARWAQPGLGRPESPSPSSWQLLPPGSNFLSDDLSVHTCTGWDRGPPSAELMEQAGPRNAFGHDDDFSPPQPPLPSWEQVSPPTPGQLPLPGLSAAMVRRGLSKAASQRPPPGHQEFQHFPELSSCASPYFPMDVQTQSHLRGDILFPHDTSSDTTLFGFLGCILLETARGLSQELGLRGLGVTLSEKHRARGHPCAWTLSQSNCCG